jgi:hypothetical protein
MKDGAVVPHVVCARWQFRPGDIGSKPMNTLRRFPESFAACVNGGLRNVEDGDVFVSAGEEIVDQGGFTAANIEDGRRATRSCLFYERERGLKVRTVPADCVWSFLCVDFFPMSLCIHTDYPLY